MPAPASGTFAGAAGHAGDGDVAPGRTAGPIPIIDFGPYLDEKTSETDRARLCADLARQLRTASEDVGFYFLAGAYDAVVPQILVREMFEVCRKFHSLDLATKTRSELDSRRSKGYMPNHGNVQDPRASHRPGDPDAIKFMTSQAAFNAAFFASQGSADTGLESNPWPDTALPEMRETAMRYDAAITRLVEKLLPVYATALGVPASSLEEKFVNTPSFVYRLTHYPETPVPKIGEMYGIYPHVDTSFFTLLAQNDVPGLSLRHPKTGEWFPVPAIPKTFLVNTGEILHRLSNGTFLNTIHSASNRGNEGKERYAVVAFVSLEAKTVIEPVIAPGAVPKWGERFTCKDIYRDVLNSPTGVSATDGTYLGAKL